MGCQLDTIKMKGEKMKKLLLNGKWQLSGDGYECTGTVPGSVYSILLENNLMEDPYYRQNELEAVEIMEHDYTFSRSFQIDNTDERTLLCCDGLDTLCDIYLNGSLVGHTSNMHRSYEFDITELLRDTNEL